MFFAVSEKLRTQVNIENLLDQGYFLNADNNNNITPGGPRSVRVSVSTRF
jgi:catecholate siderophore receptor